MEIDLNKFRTSVRVVLGHLVTMKTTTEECRTLKEFLKKHPCTSKEIEEVLNIMSSKLLEPDCTVLIATAFPEYILLLVTICMPNDQKLPSSDLEFAEYQRNCVALAKLMHLSEDIKRYATSYFLRKPAPFQIPDTACDISQSKKTKMNENKNITQLLDTLPLLKCCYQLLCADPAFFKDCWDWSEFIRGYLSRPIVDDIEKLYINHIISILSNMNITQLKRLNKDISVKAFLNFETEQVQCVMRSSSSPNHSVNTSTCISMNLKSDIVTNIEGVLLPIFNKVNYKFYNETDISHGEKIVKVDSTKVNLRSIALGISSAKPICLSGPVGCGKTTLIEYLAQKTGRIQPKQNEIKLQIIETHKCNANGKRNTHKDIISSRLETNASKKRKTLSSDLVEEMTRILEKQEKSEMINNSNGFLRIQLGDQTDSKMLLGQYRCTDVPGEFVWSPGVLTQAVMNGYWLLLEDLDSATQDTFTILSNLLENNFLNVPGFRENIKVEPGFQLFVTVRTNKSTLSYNTKKSLYTLLEKHLYTINILPLSRNELCKVVSYNYPKLATISNRIVDVFLTFSSGDHASADNLRQQETFASEKADTTESYVALPFEQVTLSNVSNSGRLVSTRDLVKLCQRSNPMFSVTSSECAYFVFQNAVDIFCSYLPQGKEKTKLICSIGAKLGIIRSRCEFLSNEYKPQVTFDRESIKAGRAELNIKYSIGTDSVDLDSNDELDTSALKRLKLSKDSERVVSQVTPKSSCATFSFTRPASCLLERVAVSVAHEEPVLLVGETGVGKTSAVQYLAQRTHHKLVVVNMNNQSDVSDLLGGFRPVDLRYVVMPLRNEFELLFRRTFNLLKNEAFLNKFAICYNQGNYAIILKLMLKVVGSVFERVTQNVLRPKELEYLPRWQDLRIKLLKLNAQLAKSINISFAFIPGSLVNCIQNGDWILLDEINLASTETLECLSTILEPDGSVVLLEKGDMTPVKRHPEFRIFACMNPNTDIGKKDLSVSIRNRFTEFFVDELTADTDLTLLISDYLANTGIQNKSVSNIVKLYKKLRELSRLELNDGLGNRPVFSLRTLCRALRICSKNLCGSIDRNLYESICMSFLTQLDPGSHQLVLELIKQLLLSNPKAILMQSIPKPGENYLNFEGYWIEQGSRLLQDCEHYILTQSVRSNLKDLARIISLGKLPILLQGPTSAGKTSLIEYVAKRSGNHCVRINNHEHTDLQEYIGTYVADCSGKLTFREGVLVQAMRNGYWIILDELNLASTDILEALNRVLDDNRELYIPETQTLVRAHPNFMLFATQNPPGLYGGRKTLSRAFKNRFIELHFAEIPRQELELILEKRCKIPPSYAKKMVLCMSELQKNRKTTSVKNVFTLRDLFRWGNRYTYADKKLLEDSKYDWNQHLIEEGYLVLSAKVRTQEEMEVIEEALYHNFKKHIDLACLFDADSNKISPVTQNILHDLTTFKKRTDIVWTRPMTRMAVLAAKALQFNEPVLLVGPTGCGKTTVCQVLASIHGVNLRILNCHMHTEGADFLGGLRPFRQQCIEQTNKLFEWADGPLIYAMQEGSYFMADEISLAEDSVLERLNCVLEPERTVLLAEKGGIVGEGREGIQQEFLVQAANGFQFLATMNPGGDFGKKELSPALRNRFTEIWCQPSDSRKDLIHIAYNYILQSNSFEGEDNILKVATYIVDIVFFIRDHIDKFKYSVRDILAWAQYMVNNKNLNFAQRAIFGLETVFLDALEMLSFESPKILEQLKRKIIEYAIKQSEILMNIKFTWEELLKQRGREVVLQDNEFGIKPFFIETNKVYQDKNFLFDVPTTKKNLFRLLSALSLHKPVLLEGPPGVGKTSIVESLAQAIGYKIVRINLCEHTDLADLFGTDLPVEDKALVAYSTGEEGAVSDTKIGSFVWRDGPLLAALKAPNTWILLDELNLAPQSVLEGLNAILDHRGEVFIPELNKTFQLNQKTRIFACQNPLRQGGGRKGLPQSFLNRFNKAYLRKLTNDDMLFVINRKYSQYFDQLQSNFSGMLKNAIVEDMEHYSLFEISQKIDLLKFISADSNGNNKTFFVFDLSDRMVKFSENLDRGITNMEFGYQGGPYEINLRDILRWCDLLIHPETGFIPRAQHDECTDPTMSTQLFEKQFKKFLLTLYERMKLVYYQRMRSSHDKLFIRNIFSTVFNCDANHLNALSEDVALYWTDEKIYLNDIVLERASELTSSSLRSIKPKLQAPILLVSQREYLKNLIECVHMDKPVILCGPADVGKTKLINILCALSNQLCHTDSIDDSVTGSFQQIDLNRHLESISRNVENFLFIYIQNEILCDNWGANLADLLKVWYNYTKLTKEKPKLDNFSTITSEELHTFRQRIHLLSIVIDQLSHSYNLATSKKLTSATVLKTIIIKLEEQKHLLNSLKNKINTAESLNTGGSFEWVDSKIVQALKLGHYINLEHVNLCSSAVLDRLNPVFEPSGRLMISEKGVTIQDTAEIVDKAENFRAFLTLDPKNGELSRPMRNRCVELALSKETAYDVDDMRSIIHISGVTNIAAINCILQIHDRITELTEINPYTISHLTQFAGLAAAYERIGYALDRAIYISGMEVYVYSASTDLMGYGLAFYQNKLREIVLEETKRFTAEYLNDLNDYKLINIILNCENLDTASLIKLQLQPLKILIKQHNIETTQNILSQFFSAFKTYKFKVTSIENLIKFYIYMLYECSSTGDIKLRNAYITDLLSTHFSSLKKLSHNFYNSIQYCQGSFESIPPALPWNAKLFPRLRDYSACEFMNSAIQRIYSLSAQLLAQLIIPEVPVMEYQTLKLQDIDALNYSQAVTECVIADKLKNSFLQNFATFIRNLQKIINTALKEATKDIDLQTYSQTITNFLWFNRLLESSQQKLFKANEMNADIIDKMLLHFKWLEKHLLRILFKILPNYQFNKDFQSSLHELKEFISNRKQPLNLLRKTYTKCFTDFQSFYMEDQVSLHSLTQSLGNALSVIPSYGSYAPEIVLKKFVVQKTPEAAKCRAQLRQYAAGSKYNYNFKDNDIVTVNDGHIPNNLEMALQKFVTSNKELKNLNANTCENGFDVNDLRKDLDTIQELLNSEEITDMPKDLELAMLPLREYFLNKCMTAILYNPQEEYISDKLIINISYYDAIPSLHIETVQLLEILKTPLYQNFMNLWITLSKHLENLRSPEEFDNLVTYVGANYSSISSFKRLIDNAVIHLQLKDLAQRSECTRVRHCSDDITSAYSYNGPALIQLLRSLLCNHDGVLKTVSLQELTEWKNYLQSMRQLMWHNSFLMCRNFNLRLLNLKAVKLDAKKLLKEVNYVQKLCGHPETENDHDYDEAFTKLVGALTSAVTTPISDQSDGELRVHTSILYRRHQYDTALWNALIGSIEVCLLNFTPLIDPVEKYRLKSTYVIEDINCLTNLTTVYDFMRIVMKYKHFGEEFYSSFMNRLEFLNKRQEKFSKKLALRPEKCLYSSLVQDIKHFLLTNCEPQALLKIIDNVQQAWSSLHNSKFVDSDILESCNETLNRIELWLTNTRHFIYHVLKRYVDYYQDFVQPLECSLDRIRSGFEGFKVILIQLKEAFAISSTKTSKPQMMNMDNGGKLHQLLADIAQFPTIRPLELYDINSSRDIRQNRSPIVNILSKIEGSECDFFRLIKIKITELSNIASVSSNLSENVFRDFDFAFNVSNQIWQEEEERYRRKKAEDESLYVTKIKCQTEDEELIELQEIDDIFPTNIQEDFGDFVQEDTLEKVMKFNDKQKHKTSRPNRIIRDEDYAFLVEHFIKILKRHTHIYYRPSLNPENNETNHLQIIEPLKERLSVFIKIFAHYQRSLNEWLDEECYNTFILAIGLHQQLLNELTLPERNQDSYNFYKDSNIPEIVSCTDVLQRIEERVQIQLTLYPEHAGLLDILRVIERIRGLPSISPVVRFNTGFQILRQKISLWNEVAHKNNNLRSEEAEVAEYVQKWTKLELQFWRNCLAQVSRQVEVNAFRYWFFMYNLLQQYLEDNAIANSYTDVTSAEKRFIERESSDKTDEVEKKTEVEVHDIIRILRTFVESSNYGDFHVRLELIQSFELYLHNIDVNSLQIEEKRTILIAGLHNLQIYFSQFAEEIEDSKKAMRAPIEKKLKELVKIESYNKDLSYFSMRNNIARVHRNLNKFLKEYRVQLQQKILPVFQPKDATIKDYNLDDDKGKGTRCEWQFKHHLIDVKSFIAPQSLRLKFANNLDCVNDGDVAEATSDATLLQNIGKYFSKSRNIVEEIVTNAAYPKLVYALENLFCQQLERCNQLRKMEVDRSQERSQQKQEAKQILQQKRKALSDFFKTLAQLGVSYKKGLLELTLRAQFEDFTLPPFSIQTMLSTKKDKHMYAKLAENIDKYFAKCVFKVRLLQNAVLSSSLADLGKPNIERIKGTAVEMFLLAQNQRHLLTISTKDIYDLRQLLQNLKKLYEISASKTLKESHLEFMKLQNIFDVLKESFSRICYVFEQFNYLLSCVPEKRNEENHVLSQPDSIDKGLLLKSSQGFVTISKYSNDILKAAKNTLADMIKNESEFISFDKLDKYHEMHTKIIDDIKKIQDYFRNSDGECLPICRSLGDLLNYIEEKTVADFKCTETVTISFSNTEKELENVIHAVLLAMQKLYSKYRRTLEKTETKNESRESESEEKVRSDDDGNDDDNIIQSQHLKKRLFDELVTDSQTLNLACIISKMSNVLLSLKHAPSSEEKLLYMLKVTSIIPLLEQYELLNEYYLCQQLSAHKITVKMLSTMLTAFLEIITKGFCVPADLMQDEEGESKKESNQEGQGFGLEDGTGEKDASDKIESEDQLDDAKRPEDREKEDDGKENNDCKEEKGIEMSEDFEGKMQDVDKPENDDDDDAESEKEDIDKEMGETEEGADKLDEQIWGDDEETEKENDEEKENDMEEEDGGKGSKDESDSHNDLNSKNDKSANKPDEHDKDALDATSEPNNNKHQEKDLDNLKDSEVDEDQINPYHNELEDPPEPEEMDLNNMDNADEQEEDDNEQQDSNPFDIDEMRENMKITEETNEAEEEKNAENEKADGVDGETSSDSDEGEEEEAGKERVDDQEISADPGDSADDLQEDAQEEQESEVETQKHGSLDEVEKEEKSDENHMEKTEEFKESNNKKSTEENIQSMPETENMSSADQVQNNEDRENVKKEQKLDDQDTGEEKDGVGQAENEMTDNGHQGISETKETVAHDEPKDEGKMDEKHKQGHTDEERTLGEAEKNQIKQLKTIDKLRDVKDTDDDTQTREEMEVESEEYQHVKEPKSGDKTTLDSATEEQTKEIKNLEKNENEEDNNNEEEGTEELPDTKETPDQTEENNPEEISAEKIDHKSGKSSESEKTKERGEAKEEQMEIDGEIVTTATVPRSNETTAHCIREILLENATNAQELGPLETLELRKMYQQQLINKKIVNNPEHDAYDQWQNISNRMLQNARELCEQLRLILEPTKCTRLKGDYRTGRRINMKKIIPYIASQFRKDKIWLRRTKPAQRDYKITIAIDDSKSMDHNNSKTLTLEAISLVAQALTLLESGRLSIVSFGETSKIVLHHTEQLDGPKLVNALTFAQGKTKIAELLDFVRIINSEEGSVGSDNGIFENLLLILSDGRNIFSEGKIKVKNSIKLARLQRIFLVYIIIDNPENKNSILDIQTMEVLPDKRINIKCYLDDFPFPYYVIVRDLNQLPLVLSEAMRQWFELVNSEQ